MTFSHYFDHILFFMILVSLDSTLLGLHVGHIDC